MSTNDAQKSIVQMSANKKLMFAGLAYAQVNMLDNNS
jgi:hypothetical protein